MINSFCYATTAWKKAKTNITLGMEGWSAKYAKWEDDYATKNSVQFGK